MRILLRVLLMYSLQESIIGANTLNAQFPNQSIESGINSMILGEMVREWGSPGDTICITQMSANSFDVYRSYYFLNGRLICEQNHHKKYRTTSWYEYENSNLLRTYQRVGGYDLDTTYWQETDSSVLTIRGKHAFDCTYDRKQRILSLSNRRYVKKESTGGEFTSIFGGERYWGFSVHDTVEIQHRYSGILRHRHISTQCSTGANKELFTRRIVRGRNERFVRDRSKYGINDERPRLLYDIHRKRASYVIRMQGSMGVYRFVDSRTIECQSSDKFGDRVDYYKIYRRTMPAR